MQEGYNLLEIRQSYGLSQTDFAKKVKMSRELVNKIENGKTPLNKPTLKKIRKFLDTNPAQYSHDVNFLGKASQSPKKSTTPYYLQRLEQKNESVEHLVPLVGIKAQAGYIKGYEQVDYMEALEQYSLPPGVNPTGAIWRYFEVDGDSMEPTLYAG
ncbi:MAG: helix-turn-helix domain-containing protein, partial [Flavisolibacter sp.]